MRILVCTSLLACWLSTPLYGQFSKDQLAQCIKEKIQQLVADKRKAFKSPQEMSENCPSPQGVVNCISESNSLHFFSVAENDFLIEPPSVFFEETVNDHGEVKEVGTNPDRKGAFVRLFCHAEGCGAAGKSIGGHLKGFLEYQPTRDDIRRAAGACLK